MRKEFILPDIGEGIVECELVEWLVHEGDWIEEDQPVADVMTDKALVQIPAPDAGRILKLYCKQGESAKVHQPLFAIETGVKETEGSGEPGEKAKVAPMGEAAIADPAQEAAPSSAIVLQAPQKALASPAVRRLARELKVDISSFAGSGKDGRVLKEDLVAVPASSPPTEEAIVEPRQPLQAMADIRVEPIRGIRAAMAKHLLDAATTIPHFTLGDEIEMSALLALKRELQLEAEHHGIRLTLMPFFIKALALAVREYPVMNSRVNAECTELHYLPECNVGLAVDSPGGLLVPNVKGVGSLSLMTVAREVQRLTLNGREGRLSPDDLAGGTITITNIGALGGTYAVPLINKPEVAIVALGRIQRLPRFDEANEVVENRIMKVSWSGDHRVIDGATLARFNNLWRSYLEKPSTLLLELS